MFVRRLDQSPRNERGGQVSYLLMGKGDFGSSNLGITWVTGGPGSEQPVDAHEGSEQVYVIVSGHGVMFVGDEQQEVGPGTLLLVPPATPHFIRNTGSEDLTYVSATSPPFDLPSPDSVFAYEGAREG
jgi:mannose-6-phosphate isomerase-like protein (cupin superfamily)